MLTFLSLFCKRAFHQAVESLLRQEKSFQFDVILGKKDPAPSHPERLRQEAKAQEEKHRAHNRHAVANALSDFVGLIGLFIFLVINQAKFRVLLKSMSDSFYGMEPATQVRIKPCKVQINNGAARADRPDSRS